MKNPNLPLRVGLALGILPATLGLSACSQVVSYGACYATQAGKLQDTAHSNVPTTWTGSTGILRRAVSELGVTGDAYITHFGGDTETRAAIKSKIGKNDTLQANTIALFCVSFANGQDYNQGGEFRPYVTPTSGQLQTTLSGKNYTTAAYNLVHAANPTLATFEVNGAQTGFTAPRPNPTR